MTGGQVGEMLTSVPGSSAAFVGGVVAYDNRLKQELLGVPAELIDAKGEPFTLQEFFRWTGLRKWTRRHRDAWLVGNELGHRVAGGLPGCGRADCDAGL